MNQDNETIAQLRDQLKTAIESRLRSFKALQEAQDLFVQAVAMLETQALLLEVYKTNQQGKNEYLSAVHRRLDRGTWGEEDTRALGRLLTNWEIKGLRE